MPIHTQGRHNVRYYKLTISDSEDSSLKKNAFNSFVWELSASNPIAPRIEFAIQSYANTQGVCFIKLYNPPLSFVKNGALLKDKYIYLEAGLKTSTITKKQGIKSPNDYTIFKGKIFSLQTAYEGTELITSFYCDPQSPRAYEKSFNIESNQKVAEVFKKQFESYYKHYNYTNVKVSIDKGASDIINKNEQSLQFKPDDKEASNYLAFLRKKMRDFELGLTFNNQNQTLYIIKDSMEDSSDIVTPLQTIECEASEFVEQPKWETIEQVTFLMHLNSKYRVDSVLKIPAQVVFNGGGILTNNQNVGLAGQNLAITDAGDFKITGVEHIGNSRDISASNWATKIIAYRVYKK